MKRLIRWLLMLLVLGGIVAAALPSMQAYWRSRGRPNFRLAKVSRGDLVYEVMAMGKVQPILKVQIGSFVSGPVSELHVDFNQVVKKGDLLAKIDPRLYEAAVASDTASLDTAKAEVERVNAQLQQAKNNEKRALALRAENPDFISDNEMDQFKFSRLSLEAQLKVAQAAVTRAEASLKNSTTNLEYTNIVAPRDGIVIYRYIDPGQTLASQFQTPVLFDLAPELDKRVYVHTLVGEAEIGALGEAAARKEPVYFEVDAYIGQKFQGRVIQRRMAPPRSSSGELAAQQSVVEYTVVVEAENPDMKLLPDMSAQVHFEIERRTNVLRIPNEALRFMPTNESWVREEDRHRLKFSDDERGRETVERKNRDDEDTWLRRKAIVWVVDGDHLKAVDVVVGITDYAETELIEGELQENQELATGIRT